MFQKDESTEEMLKSTLETEVKGSTESEDTEASLL